MNSSSKFLIRQRSILIFFFLNRCVSCFQVIPEKKPGQENGNASKRRIIVTQRPKPTATSEANRKTREAREQARRQMIEDRRRAMRSNAQKEDDTVKIFAPET